MMRSLGHTDAADFGIVRVGDKTFEEDERSARHVCNAICEQPSGAGFGEGECFLQFGEPFDDHLLDEVASCGDEVSAQCLEHPRFDLLEYRPRRNQPKVDFVRTCAIADLDIAAQTELHTNQLLDRALSHSDNVIVSVFRIWEISANALKQGSNVFLKHRLQFARRAGQQKEMRSGKRGGQNRRYVKPGSSAMSVRKHGGALRDHCLTKHALAHRDAPSRKPLADLSWQPSR